MGRKPKGKIRLKAYSEDASKNEQEKTTRQEKITNL